MSVTVCIGSIGILIACIVFLSIHQHRRLSLAALALTGICVALAAVQTVSPHIMESVTLTVTGEASPDSQGNEVVLAGFQVGNQAFEIGRPTEGKWFWGGSGYMWRNEQDIRQPAGTTRSVTLSIPVGKEREIHFTAGQWNGFVQVECGGETQIIDTYAPYYQELSVSLPDSSRGAIVKQTAITVAVFLISLLLVCACGAIFLRYHHRHQMKVDSFFKRNCVRLVLGAISCIMLLMMVHFSVSEDFWNDEIWQIWFSINGESLFKQLLVTHTYYYPSIANPILTFWYRLAPYGERWLLLPLEIATAAGVFLLGITAEKASGKRTAILTAIIGAVSANLIFQGGYEFRGYGFLFFACCFALWAHAKCRVQNTLNWRKILLLGFALWLPATLHVFGVFFSAGLVLTDFFFMVRKKLSVKWFSAYCITGILYLPWLYNMLCYDVLHYEATWQGTPSPSAVNSLLHYLTDYSTFCFVLLLIGVAWIFVQGWKAAQSSETVPISHITPLVTLAFVIVFVYFYGTCINTTATMWMERYFIVLFPCVVWMEGLGANALCDAICKKETVVVLCAAVVINGTLITGQRLNQPSPTSYHHFSQAADWFYTQQNTIYNPDTLIVYAPDAPAAAWQEYYTTKQGLRDPLAIVDQYGFTENDLAEKNLVYIYYEHIGMFDSTRVILEEKGFTEVANDEYLKISTFTRIQ